jgi:hypothetical protein
MWKNKKKYFLFPIFGVLFFILLLISLRIGISSQENIGIKQISEFFLKLIIIITCTFFILIQFKIARKYFVKTPKELNIKSWVNYVLVWGVVNTSIFLVITLPFLTFCFLFAITSIKDSFAFTIDLYFSSLFVYIIPLIVCFLGSNISYFYHGIFKPWWKKI